MVSPERRIVDELTQNPFAVTIKFAATGMSFLDFADATARPDRGNIAAAQMKLW